jgi:hypothetical protein
VRSLFVVSLPRSLSTLVYQQCCAALGLSQPRWTSAGEILNGDRLVLCPQQVEREAPKFTPPEEGFVFSGVTCFLDDVVEPRGRAYKDVVHPFVVSGWLPGRDLAVLRVRRPLADVAWSMSRRGWMYPARAAPGVEDPTEAFLRGLSRAEAALDSLEAVTVEFDDLVRDTHALRSALERLYPGTPLAELSYFEASFREEAEEVLSHRKEARWLELQRRLDALAAQEPQGRSARSARSTSSKTVSQHPGRD